MSAANPYATVLTEIEAELRRLGLWAERAPPPAALRSQMPFCVDTLDFDQWLQWLFLPRIWALLEQGARLPPHSGIAPMAEVHFQQKSFDARQLIARLRAFDQLVENAGKAP